MIRPAFALLAATLPALLPIGPEPSGRQEDPAARLQDLRGTRFLFFAVLEGLYSEGVQPDVVAKVLAGNPDSAATGSGDVGHFIPGCPVCMPVRDAFLVYRDAPPILRWLKGPPRHGFGGGLPADVAAGFLSSERTVRLKALEALVGRYVRQRFAALRLTDAERAAVEADLALGRKLGMQILNASPELRAAFEERCPSCEGANATTPR